MGVRGLKRVAEQLVQCNSGLYDYVLPSAPYNLAVDGSMWIVPCLKARDTAEFGVLLRRNLHYQLRRFDSLFRCAAHILVAVDKHAPPMKRETQQTRMQNRKRKQFVASVASAASSNYHVHPMVALSQSRSLRMSDVRICAERIFAESFTNVCGIGRDRVTFCTEMLGEGECKCVRFAFPRVDILRVLLTNDSDVITMQMRTCGEAPAVHAYLIGACGRGGVRILTDEWCRQPDHRWQLILAALVLFGNDYVDPLSIENADGRHRAFMTIYERVVAGEFDVRRVTRESVVDFLVWMCGILREEDVACTCECEDEDLNSWTKRIYWALLYALEAPTDYDSGSTFELDANVAVGAHAPRGRVCVHSLRNASVLRMQFDNLSMCADGGML